MSSLARISGVAARSAVVALLTTLVLVPVASSAQAKSSDHATNGLVTAEPSPTAKSGSILRDKDSDLGTLSHAYTRGDISCHTGPFYPNVKYKAWGADMPPYTRIEVSMSLYINGEYWLNRKVYPTTSGSGTWSTSTWEQSTALRGQYKLVVLADSPTSWGTGSDTCYL